MVEPMKYARVEAVIEYLDGGIYVINDLYTCSDRVDCMKRYQNWRDAVLRESGEIFDIRLRSVQMLT